jgi:hypothetical protein
MTYTVKADEALDPVHVGLLGATAVVQVANALAQLVPVPWRLSVAAKGGDAFHVWLVLYE